MLLVFLKPTLRLMGRSECEEVEGKSRAVRRKYGGVRKDLSVLVLQGPLLGTW